MNGDMVSGDIHDELTETNELPVIDQVYHCAEKLMPIVTELAACCRRVIIPCIGGNHGRGTLKSQMKNGWSHNAETHLFRYLQASTKHLENVEWHIPRADQILLDVMGWKVLTQHGTHIKSQGGVGGILVPLSRWAMRKASAQIYLFGHFHQACYFPAGDATIVVNGSLIGDSSYSSLLGLSYREPEQVGFLLDERRGLRSFEPVSVT
jgi:predicted phosphodiesterase